MPQDDFLSKITYFHIDNPDQIHMSTHVPHIQRCVIIRQDGINRTEEEIKAQILAIWKSDALYHEGIARAIRNQSTEGFLEIAKQQQDLFD